MYTMYLGIVEAGSSLVHLYQYRIHPRGNPVTISVYMTHSVMPGTWAPAYYTYSLVNIVDFHSLETIVDSTMVSKLWKWYSQNL